MTSKHPSSYSHVCHQADGDMADPLDGVKYTCHIGEEYAGSIAESLGLRLADFVKYA